ncbi:hypothetical protein RJ641_009710 [Dillenia turbinata]|uniref:Uncharacterized protein n=1 Tax=Dillenia turbinata TaxID=194707 RepID=A0AAN8V5T3_9MAGN
MKATYLVFGIYVEYCSRRRALVSWGVVIFSLVAILSYAIYHILFAFEGYQWSMKDAGWAKLIGFERCRSTRMDSACGMFLDRVRIVGFYRCSWDLWEWVDLVIRGDTCVGLLSIWVQHIDQVLCPRDSNVVRLDNDEDDDEVGGN